MLTFLFYLYNKSGKNLREVSQLHVVLKVVYSFKNDQVRPSKVSGTRWVPHIKCSMAAFTDKFRV